MNNRCRGFSLIELLIVIAIILVIAAIAIPLATKQLMSAHETAAIQEIKTIHAVEVQYYGQFGRYAGSLSELGPPPSGAPSAAAAELISKDLAEGRKGGYVFTLHETPPVSDQTLVIRRNWGQEPATVSSPQI